MVHTDTSEKGLETIMVSYLRDKHGYEEGHSDDYNKEYALDDKRVERFITETQPEKVAASMCFAAPSERNKFFVRLRDEIVRRGVTDLLRKGYRFNGSLFDLYYPLPSELNPFAVEMYNKNIFCVIRQMHHSIFNADDAVDVCISINGLPIATFELKNHFTGQDVMNAVKQYRKDRNPKDPIFAFKRCAVHFAVDDDDIQMCTKLEGEASWFLPFNKGVNGGAGNPVNPNGVKTAYLWEEILSKESLSDIIENYAQVVVKKDKKTGKEKEFVIWPRYHQLDGVRKLLAVTKENPIGQRFLIQHSAGSGKSNSITWLAYQLVTLVENDENIVDSVIVVTDRVNLDKQIRDNIKAFKRLDNTIAWAENSDTLNKSLKAGKKIIITTVHKFQFILDAIGSTLKDSNFAIIIDEAHSSQNGSMSADMNIAISGNAEYEEETVEDRILKMIEGRKMAPNANYYAFTATPKNKTLQLFGTPIPQPNGEIAHVPFHEYTMKQANSYAGDM